MTAFIAKRSNREVLRSAKRLVAIATASVAASSVLAEDYSLVLHAYEELLAAAVDGRMPTVEQATELKRALLSVCVTRTTLAEFVSTKVQPRKGEVAEIATALGFLRQS